MQNSAFTSRRQLLAAAAVSAVAALFAALPSAAFAGTFAPDAGKSPAADDVNMLYLIVALISVVILLAVIDQIFSAVRRGTRKSGPGGRDGSWAGHAVAVSVGLVVVLSLLGGDVLHYNATAGRSAPKTPASYEPKPLEDPQLTVAQNIKPPAGPSMSVHVNGQQYLWRYAYTGTPSAYSFHELVIPVGVTVMLDFTSSDVVHSWWVPQLGGPVEVVPGFTSKSWIRVDEPGEFNGASTTISGSNYADMTTRVIALPRAKYETWIKNKSADLQEGLKILGEQITAAEAAK